MRGAVIVDADQLSRAATAVGGPAVAPIVERFGDGVLAADGTLDRAGLASVVFADPVARLDLEAIVHPIIDDAVLDALTRVGPGEIAVVDSPLLVETNGRERFGLDGLLVVDAPEDIALDRLVRLRKMNESDARARMAAQCTRTERVRAADFIIMNMGTLDELAEMVDRAWHWMVGLSASASPPA
jgi:dephospho-CoA kinase